MSNPQLPPRQYRPEQALEYLRSLPHLEFHPKLPEVAVQLPKVEAVWGEIDEAVAQIYGNELRARSQQSSERLYAGVTAVGGYFEAYGATGDAAGRSYSTFFANLLAEEVSVSAIDNQTVRIRGPQKTPYVQCQFKPPVPEAAPHRVESLRHWLQFPLNYDGTSPEDFFVTNGPERYYLADMPHLQANTGLYPDQIRSCMFLPTVRYEA